MAKTKTPPEFPSDWHYETHLADLQRELDGRLNRKAELEAMGAHPDAIAQADEEIKAARAALRHYAPPKKRATRPRKAAETRKKK